MPETEPAADGEDGAEEARPPGRRTGPLPDPPEGDRLDDALASIHADDRSAAQLLGLLSFLADAPVPMWLLAEASDALPDPLAGAARAGEEGATTVARSLADRGLAAVDDRAVRLPAGLAAAVRERMSARERGEFASAAAKLVFRAFPDRVGRPESDRRARVLAPHAVAVADHPWGGGRATAEAVHTLARLGAFHRTDGRPERAEAAFREALRVSEQGAPVEGPLRAVLADELASVLAGRGASNEAAEMAERAVALAGDALPPDSPQLPLLLSNAATTFREVGELDRSARCYRRALDRAEAVGSRAARPLVAELLAGLADVELARRRWDAAAETAQRARQAAGEAWGEAHPQTVRATWMLGDARREQGRHREAGRLFRRALEAEEELHGPGHPAVGQKALGLGRHLESAGRHARAREAYRRAAEAFGASLGRDSDPARTAREHLERLEARA